MIDNKKPLIEYSDKELIECLNSKKELDSYFLLNLVYEENKKSDKYYHLFDEFLKMIDSKTSFGRMRGIGLCTSLVKWDKENKIDKNLNKFLSLFEDEKPTTVRIAMSCFRNILEIKPYLSSIVLLNMNRINLLKYKESMSHLIKKDIEELENFIRKIKD